MSQSWRSRWFLLAASSMAIVAVLSASGFLLSRYLAVEALVKAVTDTESAVRPIDQRVKTVKMLHAGRYAFARLRDVVRHDDAVVRFQALYALYLLDPIRDETLAVFRASLADENTLVRVTAARFLGEIGPGAEPALPTLIDAMRDGTPYVAQVAAGAVRAINPQTQIDAETMSEFAIRQEELKIEQRLEEPETLEFDQLPLGDALDYLQDLTGVQIAVDWPVLAGEGVTIQTPITIQVRQVPLDRALRQMLEGINATHRIERGVLKITSLTRATQSDEKSSE